MKIAFVMKVIFPIQNLSMAHLDQFSLMYNILQYFLYDIYQIKIIWCLYLLEKIPTISEEANSITSKMAESLYSIFFDFKLFNW